jgi:hypothetical protein
MVGGIQKGTTAWDEDSRKLDKQLGDARKALKEEFESRGLRCVYKMSKSDKIRYVGDDCFGFMPDGGAWFKDDKLVAVVEGKKQNEFGNAEERWWKNAIIARKINSDVKYITFCSGKACRPNGKFDWLKRLSFIEFGTPYIFYLKENGHSYEFVYDKIKDTLEEFAETKTTIEMFL